MASTAEFGVSGELMGFGWLGAVVPVSEVSVAAADAPLLLVSSLSSTKSSFGVWSSSGS